MGGIIFNEDCNHFIYTRFRSHIKVGLKELHEFIDQYKDTGITDFFLNVNASIAWFPCKSRDDAFRNFERIKKAGGSRREKTRSIQKIRFGDRRKKARSSQKTCGGHRQSTRQKDPGKAEDRNRIQVTE